MSITVNPNETPTERGFVVDYPVWGRDWLEEFLSIMNAARARIGLPPFMLPDGNKYNHYIDIAQGHAENEGKVGWSDHNYSGFPVGWQTFGERSLMWGGANAMLMTGSENILVSVQSQHWEITWGGTTYAMDIGPLRLMPPQEAFDGWWNSTIGHRENMLLNWGSHKITVWVGFGHGNRAENKTPQLLPAENFQALYISTDFGPTEVPEMEILLNSNYTLNGALIETLIGSYSLTCYSKIRVAHESRYSTHLAKGHIAQYGCRVAIAHEASFTYRVAGSNKAEYTTTVPVQAAKESSYRLWNRYPLAKQHAAPYTYRVMAALPSTYSVPERVKVAASALYGDLPRAAAASKANYDDAAVIQSALWGTYDLQPRLYAAMQSDYGDTNKVRCENAVLYGDLPRVKHSNYAPYSVPTQVRAGNTAPYGAAFKVRAKSAAVYSMYPVVRAAMASPYTGTVPVVTDYSTKWDLLDMNPVARDNKSFWSIDRDPAVPINTMATLLVGGRLLPIADAVVSQSEESTPWEARVRLTNLADYVGISDGDAVVLSIGGEDYRLIVTGKSISRGGPAQVDAQISAKSAVVLLDTPFAQTFSFNNIEATFARDTVEYLLGPVTEWNLPNWAIPAFRLAFEGVTPLEAAKRLVGASGGLIVADKDGSLIVQSKFPVPTPGYGQVEVAHTFTDSEDTLSVSEDHEAREGYNQFRIREGEAGFQDRLEYLPDQIPTGGLNGDGTPATEDSPDSGIVRAYPSPYRNTFKLYVAQEVGATVMVPKGEVVHDERQELVTFDKGVVGLSYPIYELVNIEWHSQALGGLSFDPGGTTLTASTDVNQGYGLATVTYRTKAFEYTTTGVRGTSALILMEDTTGE